MSEQMRKIFEEKLKRVVEHKRHNNHYFSTDRYKQFIQAVKTAKGKNKAKDPNEYKLLKRYEVITVLGQEKLIHPGTGKSAKIQFYVSQEELFDILHETHIRIEHGGRTRMATELNTMYKNVSLESIRLYLDLCKVCQKKHEASKKSMVLKEVNSRCQIKFIDMQTQTVTETDYRFVFIYQDHLTKFIILRALKSKSSEEVAKHLIDIFCTFGAPSIFDTDCDNGGDNDLEFTNNVIKELVNLWPDLKIVHGKPPPSSSQYSMERVKEQIENNLTVWMQDNQTKHWSKALCFIQMMKNRSFHSVIKCSPYEAMFGSPFKLGLATSNLADNQTDNHTDNLTDNRTDNLTTEVYIKEEHEEVLDSFEHPDGDSSGE